MSLRDYYDDLSNIPPITKGGMAGICLKDGMTEKRRSVWLRKSKIRFKVTIFTGKGVPRLILLARKYGTFKSNRKV